tara:strand:+ start:246 stop:503 length:258 start_codon:yes stop_codon:yes gene_type:complete
MKDKICINCDSARRATAEKYRSTLVGCANERNDSNPTHIITTKEIYNGWSDHVRPDSDKKSGAMSRITLVPHDAMCNQFYENKHT